jgi:tetratricopeptide (TPR) repeat protein
MQKLSVELKRLLFNPVEAITSSVETFNVWRASRRWVRILPGAPIVAVMIVLLLFIAIRASTGEQQRIATYFGAMDTQYPVGNLERVLYRDIVKLNPIAKNSTPELPSDSQISADDNKQQIDKLEPPSPEHLERFRLTLNRIKQIAPNNDDAVYRLALIDALEGNVTAANEAVHTLVESTGIPMFAAYHWEAINLLNKRLSGQAVVDAELDRVFDKAVEWRSARPDLQSAVGLRMLSQNKIDRGLELLLRASEQEPSRYLMTAKLAKNYGRERVFDKAVNSAEKDFRSRVEKVGEVPKDRIGCAEVLILKDRVKDAIEFLQAGINDQTVSKPELKLALSNVYLRQFQAGVQGKPADQIEANAIANLQLAIDTDPMNPSLGRPAVSMLSSNSKLPEPVTKALQEMLKEQLKANVATPDTLMILGSLYYQKKMYREAANVWQKVVDAMPNAVDALNNLAVLEFELPDPNPTLALERIQKAFEISPNNVEICDSYGQVLKRLDRPQDAIAKFERALRLSPNRPHTRELLAECYAQIGQKDISDAQKRLISTLKKAVTENASSETKKDAQADKPQASTGLPSTDKAQD